MTVKRETRASSAAQHSAKPRTRFSRRLIRGREEGATAIEFAMLAPVFFFLVLSIFDMGISQLISRSMDLAADDLSRMVRTGQLSGKGVTEFREQLCKRLVSFVSCKSITFKVEILSGFQDLDGIAPLDPKAKDPQNTNQPLQHYEDSSGSEIVLLRMAYPWASFVPQVSFTGNGKPVSFKKDLHSAALFRNEPF